MATRLVQGLIALLVIVLIGGVVFLGAWDFQPPSQTVEKAIPNDRFAR